MYLSELTEYAAEKYHIEEEYKWADFPGFSVLCHPRTGKWAALLMRQWDGESGTEIERCDLRCGIGALSEFPRPYLSKAVRMHGDNWINICFDDRTERDLVFRLFDRAIEPAVQSGYTIVLGSEFIKKGSAYKDVPLPPRRRDNRERGRAVSPDRVTGRYHDRPSVFNGSTGKKQDDGISLGSSSLSDLDKRTLWDLLVEGLTEEGAYQDTDIPFDEDADLSGKEKHPERLREMRRLYEYGRATVQARAENFYRQAVFMQDYEDDYPWSGDFIHFFPTYHDLNTRQLRGYFTWRTQLRRGSFQKIPASAAYIYIYELLNGIGVSGPEESLQKMREFERGYLDSGFGDPKMRANLHRWMLDLALLRDLPPELARQYADPGMLERDRAFFALRSPSDHSDDELFSALCCIGGKKLENSPVLKKEAEKGKRLFCESWRKASSYRWKDDDLFVLCFGNKEKHSLYPFYNAVYFDHDPSGHRDRDYDLDETRSFHCRNGIWQEEAYEKLDYRVGTFRSFLRGTEEQLRRYLKTGRYLKAKAEDEWVRPYVEEVIREDRQAQIEAARPKITIDLSGLEKIREDAVITRDSLLTAEERGEYEEAGESPAEGRWNNSVQEIELKTDEAYARPASGLEHEETYARPAAGAAEDEKSTMHAADEEAFKEGNGLSDIPLDPLQLQILRCLLAGQDVSDLIRSNHLMPSVAADRINEALYDEFADTVVSCEDDRLTLLEDYREDLEQYLGGFNDG